MEHQGVYFIPADDSLGKPGAPLRVCALINSTVVLALSDAEKRLSSVGHPRTLGRPSQTMPGYHSHETNALADNARNDKSSGSCRRTNTRRNDPLRDGPCDNGSPPFGDVKCPGPSSSFSNETATNPPCPHTDMSSAATDSRTPSSAGSDWRVCYVLCQHDFSSSDRDHLCFRRNEILEIVKKEESGWWAALRDDHIGWIPSAFVVEIPEATAEALLGVNEEVRSYEYEAERLYGSVPVHVQHSASVDSTLISTPGSAQDDDWVPIVEPGGKVAFPLTLWKICPRH